MARDPRALLAGVCGCAAMFLLLLVAAYTAPGARWLDASALNGFIGLQGPLVDAFATRAGRLGDPVEAGLLGAALASVALARGKPRIAVAVIFLLALTAVSSQVLKAVLAYPRYEGLIAGARVAPEAFPSGHASAALVLALAGVLVAPPRLRALSVFVGSGFVTAVAFSILTLGWHFPSDVVGGFLLATFWALLITAALRVAEQRWPERHGRARASAVLAAGVERAAALGLAAAALAGVVLVAVASTALLVFRLPDVLGYADRHTGFVVVAAAVAGSAAALLAGVAALLRRHG